MYDIKWSYMDHWKTQTPQGLQRPSFDPDYMTRYIKQIAGLGFQGLDAFGRSLPGYYDMFGSKAGFKQFLNDHGIEKVTSIFGDYANCTAYRAPHVRETHAGILKDFEELASYTEDLGAELFIYMPGSTYFQVEPITDEKIKIMCDLWNQVGRMTLEKYGLKLSTHHEFWSVIRTPEQIKKFYEWTDPRYVYYFCDTAQHVIAGVDPVQLYLDLHDRCSGMHFKDTHNVDLKGEYRSIPDAELIAPSVKRWFWEMGTPEGLCDFPQMMKALSEYNYKGWISVEHDKADIDGGDYAESTCISMWYIQNVLMKTV